MAAESDELDDRALIRYSRHILLDDIGIEGQTRLSRAVVLVVGAGGLGSAAALYLASSGVGKLIIADGDTVDLTNLQRQIVHRESAIGTNKARSAVLTLKANNSTLRVEAIESRLDELALDELVGRTNVVLDCTDNFATRHAINRACTKARVPLVSGAGIRFDGQLTTFDTRRAASPCYECLFPENPGAEEERCATMGVFAPLVGIVGAAQAAEALRVIAEVGDALIGRLLLLDARQMSWREVKYKRDPHCRVCGSEIH